MDWSQTRAYGLGLNGLYLNLRGREPNGIVEPGAEEDALIKKIKAELVEVKDPKSSLPVITRVDVASEVYQGPYARSGPDMLVGYNRGYRAGWKTILGAFPPDVLEDNTNPGAATIAWTTRWSPASCSATAGFPRSLPHSPTLRPRFWQSLESPRHKV